MNTIKLKGTYDFVITMADGSIKESWSIDNIITNAGLAQLALLAGDASAVPFTYLAVGTGVTAVGATQTTLVAEITDTGLERATGTVSRITTTQTNDTLQITHEWTSTGDKTIEEVGVFNSASNGTMLSRALTGSKSVANGEKITSTYKIKFA